MSKDYSEDKMIQETTANFMEKELGWVSIYAFEQKTLGPKPATVKQHYQPMDRIDFIEMMEESYNTSIIDFLAEQFSEKLLEDRENIKNIFKDSIHHMIAENNAKISNAKNDAKDSVKPKLNSKNKNAVKSKDLIDKISTMDNIDDINKAIQGIEIKSVLNYAKKRIKELNDR